MHTHTHTHTRTCTHSISWFQNHWMGIISSAGMLRAAFIFIIMTLNCRMPHHGHFIIYVVLWIPRSHGNPREESGQSVIPSIWNWGRWSQERSELAQVTEHGEASCPLANGTPSWGHHAHPDLHSTRTRSAFVSYLLPGSLILAPHRVDSQRHRGRRDLAHSSEPASMGVRSLSSIPLSSRCCDGWLGRGPLWASACPPDLASTWHLWWGPPCNQGQRNPAI